MTVIKRIRHLGGEPEKVWEEIIAVPPSTRNPFDEIQRDIKEIKRHLIDLVMKLPG